MVCHGLVFFKNGPWIAAAGFHLYLIHGEAVPTVLTHQYITILLIVPSARIVTDLVLNAVRMVPSVQQILFLLLLS